MILTLGRRICFQSLDDKDNCGVRNWIVMEDSFDIEVYAKLENVYLVLFSSRPFLTAADCTFQRD